MEEEVREYEDGQRTIIFNLCNLDHRHQTKFLQMYQKAVKSGVDGVQFVKMWNNYAQDITEHVFWNVKQRESQERFTERGK
jgi:hypothetical protein